MNNDKQHQQQEEQAVVVRRRRRRRQPEPRLLEFYVISAQELRRVRTPMQCYVVAYVSGAANNKVKTHIDFEGDTDPSWNEKLCLRVEEAAFAKESNSQLTFDIFTPGFFREKLVGTVRISLDDAVRPGQQPYPITSFLVFTGDGDSQGMLNVCVPPGGKFPKRLDSLSFKRVHSDKGVMQLHAVPSFKQGELVQDDQDEETATNNLEAVTAAKLDHHNNKGVHDPEDEELGIYDQEAYFGHKNTE